MQRFLVPLALGLMVAAPAQAQLFAAIAPEARTGQIGGPDVTLFVTAINNTEQTLTQCEPVAEFFEGLTYQTVDVTNQLTGTANTPVDLTPGGIQGFVIALPTDQVQVGRLVARVECVEENSVRQFALGATINIVDDALADIIAIGQTPSADGVVRIAEAGGTEVFAVAGINIGETANVDVRVRGTDYMPPVGKFSVCETGGDGACLEPPTSQLNIDFANEEVRTFSVFTQVGPESGVAFLPDLQRVRLVFEATVGGWEVGAASAAYTAPAPEQGPQTTLSGLYSVYYSTPYLEDSQIIDQGFIGILGDEVVAWGARANLFQGPSSREWIMGGTPVGTSTNTETGELANTGHFLVSNFDTGFQEAGVNFTIDPQRGFTGEIAPSDVIPGLDPTAQAVTVRAAYQGFLSNTETPYDQLIGNWDIVSGSVVIGEMEVRADQSLAGEFFAGNVANCFFGGDLNPSTDVENLFHIEWRFNSSLVGCADFFNGDTFNGMASVGTDIRPVSGGFPMIAFLYDDAGNDRSALSILLAKRN